MELELKQKLKNIIMDQINVTKYLKDLELIGNKPEFFKSLYTSDILIEKLYSEIADKVASDFMNCCMNCSDLKSIKLELA